MEKRREQRRREWRRICILNRKIAERCNFAWVILLILCPCYLLALFFMQFAEQRIFLMLVETGMLLGGFLAHSAVAADWNWNSAFGKRYLTAGLLLFPVSRKLLLLSHLAVLLVFQLGMAALTELALLIYRWQLMPESGDGMFFLCALVNTALVTVLRDTALVRK